MAVIIGRFLASMKEPFQLTEEANREVGLRVKEGKTNYMVAANTQNRSKPRTIQIGRYDFEIVGNFIYLVSLMTGGSNVSGEIPNCLIAASRSYCGLKSQFKSQVLSRKTKILIYKTPVRPLLTYASESWTMTKSDERRSSIFERKIPCRMYGAVCEKGQWWKR